MKRLLVTSFLLVTMSLQARIITISSAPNSPGQYTDWNTASGFFLDGDTVYVHGSIVNYGSAFIFRNDLVIIGTGHDPQKQFPYVSAFTDIDILGNNCQLLGLVAEKVTLFSQVFTMKRCKILGSGFGPGVHLLNAPNRNILLEANVFTSASFNGNIRIDNSNPSDIIVIRNNIFSEYIDANIFSINTFLITNNIFLRGPNAFFGMDRATISNNIFYGSSPFVPFGATITMRNNISYQCPDNSFTMGPNITLINNLEDIDPQFVNYPGGNAVYNYLHDYHLLPGSPGIATGSDGTDRGVYGGFGTIFNMEGEPPIAEISSVTITSPTTVAPGGTLNITVTTKRVH